MSPAVKVGHGHYMAWTVASLPPPGAASDSTEPVHASLFMDTSAGIMQSDTAGVTWRHADVDPKLHLGLTTTRTVTDRDGIHGFGDMGAKYQGQKAPFASMSGTDPAFFQLGPGRALQAVVHSKPCAGWAGCANLTATGLPRSIGCIQTSCCNCPFRFDSGNTVRFADGSLVISINLYYSPVHTIKGDGSSVALFASDREGLNWEWRSDVATAEEFQWSGEGPNESTMSLLSDGTTLICIIRMDAGDGHATGKPYAKRFSTDQGKSWGPLQNMSSSIGTAKPRLLLMDGSLILVGGRPGNWAWLNPDGMGGDTWIPHEFPFPPPAAAAGSSLSELTRTTSYNGVAAVNATHGAFTFDDGQDNFAVPFALVSGATRGPLPTALTAQ